MKEKLQQFQQKTDWIERMDVSVEPVARLTTEEETNDDLKREMIL
jgi:hypothetical protein